jgi:hypothetical protein
MIYVLGFAHNLQIDRLPFVFGKKDALDSMRDCLKEFGAKRKICFGLEPLFYLRSAVHNLDGKGRLREYLVQH